MRSNGFGTAGAFAVCMWTAAVVWGAPAAFLDPAKTDEDFPFVGEFVGDGPAAKPAPAASADPKTVPWGAQVAAQGKGQFLISFSRGGLPGDGWDGSKREIVKAERKDGAVRGKFSAGNFVVSEDRLTLGEVVWPRIVRTSPTLGAKPPEGAIVLFDGGKTDAFASAKTSDGLLHENATTKQLFRNFKLHVEFRTPYKPEGRGQDRGNSGVYLQKKFETQILDSFGQEESIDNCGAVYSIQRPIVNACLPPLVWQTYDIDYFSGKYDADGKVLENPRVTARLNGVLVQDGTELTKQSRWAAVKAGPDAGPLWFQGHGNPVRFRNIWVVEQP